MEYSFFGWETADSVSVTDEYPGINSPRDLYDALSDIWCEYTCAPRLREGGNFHCYNVVGDRVFDLTSEQFGDEELDYTDNPEQFREVHFAGEEKKQRYEYLRRELKAY